MTAEPGAVGKPAHPVDQLTTYELRDYRRQLEHGIEHAPPGAPALRDLRRRLDEVIAEQEGRAEAARRPAPPAGEPAPQAACRCACGFTAGSLTALEDHLFTFPEDDHYELAPPPR